MKPFKILIVVDDHQLSLDLKKQIEDTSHELIESETSGEAAIKCLKTVRTDIVLIDINLQGGMGSVETANYIDKVFHLPVVFISDITTQESINRAINSKAYGYLVKPYNNHELSTSIEVGYQNHRRDQRLVDYESRISSILNNVKSGVISTDLTGVVSFINPSAELCMGIMRENAVGKIIWEIVEFFNVETEKPDNLFENSLKEGKYTEINNRVFLLYRNKEEKRYLQFYISPHTDSNSHVKEFNINILDITSHYKIKNRLEVMSLALQNVEDAVLITDGNFNHAGPRIKYVNEGFTRMTGWAAIDALDEPLDLLWRSEAKIIFNSMMMARLKENRVFEDDTVCHKKDGTEIKVHWEVKPIVEKQSMASQWIHTIRDVTHLRSLEENIRQAQKVDSIGKFTGGISHDFNNLLSVINSYADLLTLKIEESSPLYKYAENIRLAGSKGADLVSKLMAFGRRENPSLQALNLGEVMTNLEHLTRRLIREDIELTINTSSSANLILADQGQLEQIMINLCVNARDALSEGGKIEIKVINEKILDEQIRAGTKIPKGNYEILSVSDNGCGMDESTIKSIFEPFFTTKEVGKGTGLGLSTVADIVYQLEGHLTVESSIGKGTCFKIYIPNCDQAPVEHNSDEPSLTLAYGSESILVVEDDETFADCVSGLLSLHGYNVHSSKDGREALDYYGDNAGDFKLLIADIVLPKISGRELASRMLEKNPELKVIFMTGYDDEMDTFYSFPADSFTLQKPFSLNNILSKVRELLDQSSNNAELMQN